MTDATAPVDVMSADLFAERYAAVVNNIATVLKGKDDVIRLALVALLAGGSILFEDVPGTGKTILARAIARSIDASVGRVQCTPDLLPADLTGSSMLDRHSGDLVFRAGPVFANVLLCDEINRATPKTQSALLEAMQEHTVTVDGLTHALPTPFLVLATQNPIELAGTFALPEAQLDRFLFKLSLGYPDREAEAALLEANRTGPAIDDLGTVIGVTEVRAMMAWAADVSVSAGVVRFIVDIVRATRQERSLQLGGSPRAALALQRAGQVMAASQRRDDVLPDDVKKVALPVLAHRLVLTPDAELAGDAVEQVIARVLARVAVPIELAGAESMSPPPDGGVTGGVTTRRGSP